MSLNGSTDAGAAQRRSEPLLMRQFARSIEKLLSPFCEVIIHDFADLERSIIHIEGALLGHSIGGAATDLLLGRVRNGEPHDDLHNCKTTLAGVRKVKSSTIFLRDADGVAYGAFCINHDMTALVGFQNIPAFVTHIKTGAAVTQTLTDDVNSTVQAAMVDAVAEQSISTLALSRDDKVNLIARLDRQGLFEFKRAVSIIADKFGISRATICNYLREARERNGATARPDARAGG